MKCKNTRSSAKTLGVVAPLHGSKRNVNYRHILLSTQNYPTCSNITTQQQLRQCLPTGSSQTDFWGFMTFVCKRWKQNTENTRRGGLVCKRHLIERNSRIQAAEQHKICLFTFSKVRKLHIVPPLWTVFTHSSIRSSFRWLPNNIYLLHNKLYETFMIFGAQRMIAFFK